MFKKGDYIQIVKQNSTEDPENRTAGESEWIQGKENPNISIPNGYTAIGVLAKAPEMGKRLQILREWRNGVKLHGLMTTSPLVDWEWLSSSGQMRIWTLNSVYIITRADPDKDYSQKEDVLN